MNQQVQEFLDVGRNFRSMRSRGDMLVIEYDQDLIEIIKHYAKATKYETFIQRQSLEEACVLVDSLRFKFVVIGMDGQEVEEVCELLEHIENTNPSCVSIVYSSCVEEIEKIRNQYPRTTTIVKGEGLENVLKELNLDAVTRTA